MIAIGISGCEEEPGWGATGWVPHVIKGGPMGGMGCMNSVYLGMSYQDVESEKNASNWAFGQ